MKLHSVVAVLVVTLLREYSLAQGSKFCIDMHSLYNLLRWLVMEDKTVIPWSSNIIATLASYNFYRSQTKNQTGGTHNHICTATA